MTKQLLLDIHNEIIVDLFAGGGGMSVAFEMAFGRSPDIAINHDDDALSMHRANHPQTRHFIADVFEVCPRGAVQGKPVGWLHLSPDCTHHSQASGGQPRSRKIRGLSWVGARWAGQVAPRVISLENVTQILKWGPLIAKRDKATGRVMKLDGAVAAAGERVPVEQQFLIPDKQRAGRTWRRFVATLESLGYAVDCQIINAADCGGHTTRTRLFMLARRDGAEINWPVVTHYRKPSKGQKKWEPAADCLDWSLPCPSIFARKRPLADATMRRIAKGIYKHVLSNPKPFIVPIAHYNGSEPVHPIDEPLRTVTAYPKGGTFAVATPTIVPATHQGDDRGRSVEDPLPTITAAHRGELMVSTPLLAKFRGDSAGSPIDEPVPTITSGGDCARPAGAPHALGIISPVLVQAAHGDGKPDGVKRWGDGSNSVENPLGTITASGGHALASAVLVGVGGRAGQTEPKGASEPMNTGTAKADAAVATAYLAQMNGGFNETPGHAATDPLSTITGTGTQQQLVMAHLTHLRNNCDGRDITEPVRTISAGGEHHGLVSAFMSSYYTDDAERTRSPDEPAATITTENRIGLVECILSPEHEAGALRVAAFLMRYYGEGGQWGALDKPIATITTKDRLALVTVMIQGVPHAVIDIGLRMLQPRELYNGQDFPKNYIIDRGHDGRIFSKSAQVRMCGNSVDPKMAAAFLKVNAPELAVRKIAA